MDDLDLGATIRGFNSGQKVFSRYTLKKLLGRGGMGVVWLARDESLERDVAIKMLPEIVANDPAAIRELKRETSRSQRLSHPRILRIYDFVESASLCGITMEIVEGGTLSARRLEQPGEVFAVHQLDNWVRQLCTALDYAHGEVQIVHRDLKPANLMLDRADDLKVADFGIARSISDSVSRVSAQAGSSGTPVYMSPQQMMGEDPAVADDIYALGATLYELLTGKPPFHSGNIIAQVQSKVPAAVNERRTASGLTGDPVPPAWEQTIAACLAKEPKNRPASAGEVAERLGLEFTTKDMKSTKRGSKGEVERGVPTRSEPVQRPGSTSKTPLISALAAGVLLLAGAGYYFGVQVPERNRRAEISRLENEGKSAEALKLRNQQELAAIELKPRLEQERLAVERLANARGGLVVRTTPSGAEVRIGALALDKSPLTLREQKLGKYPVKVRADGYEEWNGEVELKENEFAELDIPLVRSTGGAQITSTPSGLRFILTSGPTTLEGTTPATLPALPTGDYSLQVQREGWPEATQKISIKRGAQAGATAEFPGGTLEITSTPAGAAVWAQGKNIGTTPFRLTDLPPGPVELEYRLKGYKIAPGNSVVKPGATASLAVSLEKLSDRDPTGEIAGLEKNWAEYKRIATRIQQLASDGKYPQVTDQMVLSLDQYVTKVSVAVGKMMPRTTVLFYNLPVSITGTKNGSPQSVLWSAEHKTDHWVIKSDINLFIAWRQDAAYFCVYQNGKVPADGFAATLRRGDEVIRRLLSE